MVEPDRSRLAEIAPLILVGRDRRAGWVVMEIHGRCGGLFCDEAAALRYAKEVSGGHPEAIEFARGPVDLKISRGAVR
ncbi:hypothetical protein [Methylovirgula sp. HY1]|uniref:hypothetical protein n=1 Tax=Methylovirgula sp. HY1 TaxID=2822761 RepID=UPI001C5A989A|nr:hypothetical protein [Methylovirgula sp. HY1]QXX73442.1 hypothetical protein MHY1_00238 [Methylovirgula sp. HY1]